MQSADDLKRAVARAALDFVPDGEVIGVGSGSTANHFIDLLGEKRHSIPGAVASSDETASRLRKQGIDVLELNMTGSLAIYIDGADEINSHKHMIKGGGGALTREKIVAAASQQFVCIVDHSKHVEELGVFPLPIEVIPMARSFVARQLVELGGDPEWREATKTDNGNMILDIHNLTLSDPLAFENTVNQIPGVVTVGLFAKRPADIVITAQANGDITTA